MAIVNSTPPYQQFYDDNGNPLSGGKVYSYTAGTLTPRATYTDQGGLTPNANPVILDSAGRADIWLDNSSAYKFIVKTSADVTIRTVDNITPFNTASGLSVLGNIAANTIVGNNTGASAAPTALTATQAQANMINNLSAITIDTAADYIPFYDSSGATAGKTLANVFHGTLSSGYSGSTNNSASGSGADVDHTPNYSIPANYLTAGKVLRITAHFRVTTGSSAPTLLIKLKAGSTLIAGFPTAAVPLNSLTNVQYTFQYILTATAAPSASSAIECAPVTSLLTAMNSAQNYGSTAMPVNLATNGALTLQMATQWSAAGTGTNTATLSQFIVEALN